MPIFSMTGFGQSRVETELGELRVELKSVNSRYADIAVYLPRELSAFEIGVRDRLKSALGRGKISCGVRWKPAENSGGAVLLNRPLLEAYRRQLLQLQEEWRIDKDVPWSELLRLPGAVNIEQAEFEPERIEAALNGAIDAALAPLLEARQTEGAALARALLLELDAIENAAGRIEPLKQAMIAAYRGRLEKLVEDFRRRAPEALDDHRLEAEVLLCAERSDITEELVRLRAHCAAFREKLAAPNEREVGKALEFLGQELLREINTIGSKARQTEVAALVVEMKQATERIREQAANVL